MKHNICEETKRKRLSGTGIIFEKKYTCQYCDPVYPAIGNKEQLISMVSFVPHSIYLDLMNCVCILFGLSLNSLSIN
jgi:hypothetical protein